MKYKWNVLKAKLVTFFEIKIKVSLKNIIYKYCYRKWTGCNNDFERKLTEVETRIFKFEKVESNPVETKNI